MTRTTLRREDARLLTGSGRYTADTNLPGQLHAVLLRADRPHAVIAAIDTTQALAMPGVKAVLTAADLDAAGWNSMPGGVPFDGKGGQKIKKPFWPALAKGRVHFVGQPVALIVADSVARAQDAAEAVSVDYEDLPAAIGFAAATRAGAPQLHAEAPGNIAFEFESGDAAAVEAAFARAALRSKVTFESQRVIGAPMELRAFLAEWKDGGFTVHTPSQGMTGMRSHIAQVTGLPETAIRVLTGDVGGSFGLRSHIYPEHIAVMLASKLLNRPVKWVAMRSELFLSENHGRSLSLNGEIALDKDGNFLAIRWDHHADIGAYATPFGTMIGSRSLCITMGGVYRIPAMYGHCRVAYSNAAQVSSYRGAGRPDIACAVEMLVDKAAHEHGFDPIALRRRNMVAPDAMPYKTANGTVYDCGEFAAVMDKALKIADWDGFATRRKNSEAKGLLRGIGIATFLEISGAGWSPKDQVSARFDSKGDMHVYAVSQSNGQGHETTFTGIVTDNLGLPAADAARVSLHEGDPDTSLIGNGTGGSRSLYGAGSALKLLAQKIIDTASPHAAAALGAGNVEYRNGQFHAGAKSIGLLELAQQIAPSGGGIHPLNCGAEGTYGATFPNGCHIAEVEIDPHTGITDVLAYTTVDDVGAAIDHSSIEGQVHGGVMQGVGQVLGEEAVYDAETGQLLTASFLDYVMPRADWMHGIRCGEHNVPTKTNALGAKGVGESGTSGSLPTVMNAILNAVRPHGVNAIDMPVTPDKLWRALQAAG
jgi:carbon-monoxide dehydrogenase large subunit